MMSGTETAVLAALAIVGLFVLYWAVRVLFEWDGDGKDAETP